MQRLFFIGYSLGWLKQNPAYLPGIVFILRLEFAIAAINLVVEKTTHQATDLCTTSRLYFFAVG